MKVFLSWSGASSHKVALIFREWLPSVIQEIEPYVSSEDIDKGARWSTDIAVELSDSKYGILCVTRENMDAPWLIFEAGALSKTMDKSFVSPFLFDIKRSEIDGPILQFQSTIFEKEDLRKLVISLNKACGTNSLGEERLNRAFEVWYPTLEKELEGVRNEMGEGDEDQDVTELQSSHAQAILEEILDLSRSNQKLIRNQETMMGMSDRELNDRIKELMTRVERVDYQDFMHERYRIHPMVVDELLFGLHFDNVDYTGVQIALGLMREQYPWIYDVGVETIKILRSRQDRRKKYQAIEKFEQIVKFLTDRLESRKGGRDIEEIHFFSHRIRDALMRIFEQSSS